MSDDQDWRLKAELEGEAQPSMLERVVHGARSPDIASEAGAAVPHEVAVTHDGDMLFAYASTSAALTSARQAIETVLQRDGVHASMSVSNWDDHLDEWVQVDPPPSVPPTQPGEGVAEDRERVEERTMVVSAGKMVRAEVEQTMREWASKLDLRCEIIEHRHLLTTQVAFTVTGPRRAVDEFAAGLRAEELATIRTERAVMLSPL